MSDSIHKARHLEWPNCLNVRDLGGLPTVSGGTIKWGSIIRSDFVNDLSSEGHQALLDYGVRTTIDLRAPHEAEKSPSIYAAEPHPLVTYINQPLEHFYPHVGKLISNAESRGAVYCIILDHYSDLIARAMREIANAADGAVLIHCHSGKDRTGTICGLLLKLAGVNDEVIAADYAESQTRLWSVYEKAVEEAGGPENVNFWSRPTVTAQMMHMMLDHVTNEYGDVEAYLTKAGLTPNEIEKIKMRLR